MSNHIYFEICRKKTSNATYSLVIKNGEEVVTKNIQVTYRVHASEGAGWSLPRAILASDVDEEMVRNAPAAAGATFNQRLPKAGDTTYESSDGLIHPWWRCTSVSISRNPSNGLEFEATCTFIDDTGKEAGVQPPTAVNQVDPVIKYSFNRFETTAWTEDNSLQDKEQCVLPTGTLFSNPPVKIVGEEIVTYSQYETGFGVTQILGDGLNTPGRLFSVNSEQWQVEKNGSSSYPNSVRPRHAMIDDIAYEETTLLLSNGSRVPCQRVTYTICIRRYQLESLKDDGTTETIRPGWDQPRVLADTRCKSSTGDLMVAANIESWGNQQTYLKTTGEPHPKDKQFGIPPYKILRLQPQLDFSSFLL